MKRSGFLDILSIPKSTQINVSSVEISDAFKINSILVFIIAKNSFVSFITVLLLGSSPLYFIAIEYSSNVLSGTPIALTDGGKILNFLTRLGSVKTIIGTPLDAKS